MDHRVALRAHMLPVPYDDSGIAICMGRILAYFCIIARFFTTLIHQ